MTTATIAPPQTTRPETAVEYFDVLVIGAGLSGVGAGYHLQTTCPQKTFAILEGRDRMGGTWDLFKYPGIRSDSDMYTLGYAFKPWLADKSIADGASILEYIRDTAKQHDIDRKIRYGHKLVSASWSTPDARWTVEIDRGGERVRMQSNFLYMCTGYYDYDKGFTPEFPGIAEFGGEVVHPQLWPENLDYAGKRVVVIGSGATAVTLLPSLAEKAEHVTMLQRSPTYIVALPAKDPVATWARKRLPVALAYPVARWNRLFYSTLSFQLSRKFPNFMKKLITKKVREALPEGYAIDPHFTPSYNPWDQRICLVPDGDLFKAISRGDASIATGKIKTFTKTGITLESGETLDADIVITATGLNLKLLGGVTFAVDGVPVVLNKLMTYKGMMFSHVPNLALAVGYTNASWTLKIDLISGYICRLLNYMDKAGFRQCMPMHPDPDSESTPFLNLTSGYVTRAEGMLPKQGVKKPWKLFQSYIQDLFLMKFGTIHDGAMQFSNKAPKGDRAKLAA